MKFLLAFMMLHLLLFSNACKNDDNLKDTRPRCQSVEHAPQEFLDYWFFPKGSWWVYKLKDSDPAVYDTVNNSSYTTTLYKEPFEEPGLAGHCRLFYISNLQHSNKTYFSSPQTEIGTEGLWGYRFNGKWAIDQSWNNAPHAEEGFIFFHPFSVGEVLSPYHNWVADTNAVVTPSYTFPNSAGLFSGYGGNTDTSAYPQRRIYFTKGVGITKRRYYNNQVWELVNYHINH